MIRVKLVDTVEYCVLTVPDVERYYNGLSEVERGFLFSKLHNLAKSGVSGEVSLPRRNGYSIAVFSGEPLANAAGLKPHYIITMVRENQVASPVLPQSSPSYWRKLKEWLPFFLFCIAVYFGISTKDLPIEINEQLRIWWESLQVFLNR